MYLPVRAMPLNSSVSIKLDAKSLMEATADINQIPAKVRRRRAYGLLKPAGAAGLALPDRRRSGPLGGQGATRSERPWGFILFPDVVRGLHPGADDDQPDQGHGNENLPTQTNDLVVTKTREGGTHPQEHGDHRKGLGAQPDPARNEAQGFDGRQ